MQTVSLRDNLHEISKPIFWKITKKIYIKMLSAGTFIQHAKGYTIKCHKCFKYPVRKIKSVKASIPCADPNAALEGMALQQENVVVYSDNHMCLCTRPPLQPR